MKWRDVIIGAFASLLVTILGGVAIFYVTKEPEEKTTEKLAYVLNQPAQFSGGSEDVAFSTVTLSNLGGVAAKNVAILISLKSSEIKDLSISSEKGLREIVRERKSKSVRIVYETFLPREQVTLNLLLTKSEQPTIDVRSDATLGEQQKKLNEVNYSQKSKINAILEKLVPTTGILTGLVMALGAVYLRRRGFFRPSSDKNNVGFLLLHNGLINDAELALRSAVLEGGNEEYSLSNYAVCKAAQGDFDQAQNLLKAASFRNSFGHAKAVLRFNEALVQLLRGDKNTAVKLFKEAISLSPRAIRRYCQKSNFFGAVRTDPEFSDLIKDR